MDTRTTKQLRELQDRLSGRLDQLLLLDDVRYLRRIAMTLHGWYVHECNGTIQRDEATGKPMAYNTYSGNKWPIPDRERGAEKRLAEWCKEHELHYYLQTDPRGGTLYLSQQPITQRDYTSAVFVW